MSEKIVIKFDPKYKDSGLTSFVSWVNADTKRHMELLFGMRKNEKLTGIEITEEGITARFDYVKVKEGE